MKTYKFTFNDKTYELGEDNCDYFLNDETEPVTGINKTDIITLLNEGDDIDFDVEYYDQPCESCKAGVAEKKKAFEFLEYHFYIYTKNNEYIISTISREYKNTSFNRLYNAGKVDNSYIVSVMVCINCSNYSVEIEQCEV